MFFLAYIGATIIGMSKAGIKGIDMMTVTLMALAFGGKASTGVVLPLLCIADVAAVIYYNRHAQWEHFRRLLPWVAAGLLIGVFTGKYLPEAWFRKLMAGIILITVVLMVWLEWRRKPVAADHTGSAAALGVATGFTSMIGNLAGAFSNIYFMAMRMPKDHFIGTAAWLFLVINLMKLPFQAFYWHNITTETLKTDLLLLPNLALGFVGGLWIVRRINEDWFRRTVLLLTLVGAVFMLI